MQLIIALLLLVPMNCMAISLSLSSLSSQLKFMNRLLNFNDVIPSRSENELKDGIARFYDETTGIWLDVWGDHLHHGYYDLQQDDRPIATNHRLAQETMIDKAIDWAYGFEDNQKKNGASCDSNGPKSMVDVGCGVGGSSRHISRRFGLTKGRGISLSPYQIELAGNLTRLASVGNKNDVKLGETLKFMVADAMEMPFKDGEFDLAYSMESGEHMPNKKKFVRELARVVRPGGRILIVTWCHRELQSGETTLPSNEQYLLQKINDAFYLPEWCAGSHYVELLRAEGLEDVRIDDWSEHVKPFWPAVIRSALKPANMWRVFRGGMLMMRATWASIWMKRGLEYGTIRFVIVTARKPLTR